MKRLLLVLILTLSFYSLTKANDISDFEIEGISINISTLDFMSKKEIKNNILPYFETKRNYYISNFANDLKLYDQVEIKERAPVRYQSFNGIQYLGRDIHRNTVRDLYPDEATRRSNIRIQMYDGEAASGQPETWWGITRNRNAKLILAVKAKAQLVCFTHSSDFLFSQKYKNF